MLDHMYNLCMLDSIISHAISFSRWLRCCPNSGSGQCRSRMKDCNASSFQKRSSEVAQPLLKSEILGSALPIFFRTHGHLHEVCSSLRNKIFFSFKFLSSSISSKLHEADCLVWPPAQKRSCAKKLISFGFCKIGHFDID